MPHAPIKSDKDGVEQYTHEEQKRLNNPPVGLVTAETDHLNGKKTTSSIHIWILSFNGLEKLKASVLKLTLFPCMFMNESTL